MSQQAMKTLFCQISKVDEEKRIVTGIGASEAIDAEGEIFDYDSSKPYIETWSQEAYERTSAQDRPEAISYGNIREMHQLSAIGKVEEPIVFDDAQKLVILKVYISDDDAWKKCQDGTYTGFSIRGPLVGKKWSDPQNPGVLRYTCAPVEFSVCDLPCNLEAAFLAVKAGGVTEQRQFKSATAKKEGETPMETQKAMYDIGDLANVICSLRWTQDGLAYEREVEGDNSPVPDKLKGAITDLCGVLVDLAREETAELVGAMKAAGATKMVAKAKTEGLDRVKKCIKALDSVDGCMKGECDHEGIHECAKAIADAHAKATKAMSAWDDDNDDKDSKDDKSSDKAAKAATATPAPAAAVNQGASPENGEKEMDEAQKAQLEKAAKDSAEALEVAKANATGLQQVADALGKLTSMIAGEPVAAKSVGPGAVATVTKSAEMTGREPEPAGTSPNEVAKSILSNPRAVSANELSTLRIGR